MAGSRGGAGHIVAGGLAMIGMVIARAGDTCASAGSRAARSLDDVAGLSARGARGFGDAAELGARRLGDDAWLRPGVDSETLRLARTVDPAELGAKISKLSDDEVLGDIAEFAAETAWDVSDIVLEFAESSEASDVDPQAHDAREMACPTRVGLSHDPGDWERMVSRGVGVRCSPWIVFGVAGAPDGDEANGEAPMTLRMGRRDDSPFVPVEELAAQCWQRGLSCIFVGCDEWECRAEVPNIFPRPVRNLTAFTTLVAKQATLIEHRPAFVAIVRGDRGPRLQRLMPRPDESEMPADGEPTPDPDAG